MATDKRRMLVDVKSRELAEHFMSDVEGHTEADIVDLAEEIQIVCEDALKSVEAGVMEACTCRMSPISSVSIDPPHRILDKWCPIHGRDPDDAYSQWKDEGRNGD